MTHTYTILERNFCNKIQIFEGVTSICLVTTAVSLEIYKCSLTFVIFTLFENELCQCLMCFIACNTIFSTRTPIGLSTGARSITEIKPLGNKTSFSYQEDPIWFLRRVILFILSSQWVCLEVTFLYSTLILICDQVELANHCLAMK